MANAKLALLRLQRASIQAPPQLEHLGRRGRSVPACDTMHTRGNLVQATTPPVA